MKEVTLTELILDLTSSPLGIQDLLGEMRHYVKGYHEDKYVLRFDNGYGAVVYDEGTDYPMTAYWVRWSDDSRHLNDFSVAIDPAGRSTYTARDTKDLQLHLAEMSSMVSPYEEL